MLWAANTDLFNPLIPLSKYTISIASQAIKCQLKPIGGFLFFAPSRTPMG